MGGVAGICSGGAAGRSVFDMIPNAEHDGEQFVADLFVVFDGIQLAAPFGPPVTVFVGWGFVAGGGVKAQAQFFGGEGTGKRRGCEGHRGSVFFSLHQDGRAEAQLVGFFRSERFAKLSAALASFHEGGAGFCAEATVTGAIDEDVGGDAELIFAALAVGDGVGDGLALHLNAGDGGIEHQGQVFFCLAFLVKNEVEHRGGTLRVAQTVFESDFFDDAGFPGFGGQFAAAIGAAGAVGSDDVHAHFAGGVAAEHGTIVAEDDLGSTTGGGDGTGDSGGAASGDQDFGLE